jgi:hypothetical protein
VSFAWWGGLLGPKLLHHVRCPQCRTEFNARTGRSNRRGITVYVLVAAAVLGGLIWVVLERL